MLKCFCYRHISLIFKNMPYSIDTIFNLFNLFVKWFVIHKAIFCRDFSLFKVTQLKLSNCISFCTIFPIVVYLRNDSIGSIHILEYSIFWNILYSKIWKIGCVTYIQIFSFYFVVSKYSISKNIPFSRISFFQIFHI